MKQTKQTQNSKKPVHSPLGGSGAHIWTQCEASIQEQAKIVKSRDTEYSIEGHAAHQLMDQVLKHSPNAMFYVGKQKFNGVKVTKEMASAVDIFCDHVIQVRNEMLKKYKSTFMFVEHEMEATNLHPKFYGTGDVVIGSHFGPLHILDYKHGAGVAVSVEENEQLMYYARLMLEQGDFDPIYLHIVQPRCEESETIQTWKTSAAKIYEYGDFLVERARRTEKKNPQYKIGDWCQFCKAKNVCKARTEQATKIVKEHFKNNPLPSTVASMTDKQVAEVLSKKKIILGWLKAVEDLAFERLGKGKTIPGLKLVKGRGARFWGDSASAAKYLGRILGDQAYTEKELISVAQAEKLLDANQKEKLLEFISYSQGSVQIAPSDDRRKAIDIKFEKMEEF